MNDLDRIKEIERIFGFPLHRVERLEDLGTEKGFEVGEENEAGNYSVNEQGIVIGFPTRRIKTMEDPVTKKRRYLNVEKGARNYCINKQGDVIGLSLDYCPVFLLPTDLMADFSYITHLMLRYNEMTECPFLKSLKTLQSLDVSRNLITDLSPLKDLKSLTYLNVSANLITDISLLRGVISLTSLSLSHNKISDISPLMDIKALTSLDLMWTNVSDLTPLKELKSLTSLNLFKTKVSDISALKELRSLTSIVLIQTEISDISVLKELRSLTSVILSSTKILDISVLKELSSLTSIILSQTEISDLSPLKDLKSLTSLILSRNKISDLTPLKNLNALTSLDLSNNQVSDLSPLKDLNALASLDLSDNQVSDLSPLKNLKSLTSLDLTGNKIKSLPEWITELNMEIHLEYKADAINLGNNPIESPPLYIVQRGNNIMKKYFEKGEPYLSSFSIKNYFSLEDIEIADLSDKKEIYFLGENGDGKTTLLQGIALSLKGNQNFGMINDTLKDNEDLVQLQKAKPLDREHFTEGEVSKNKNKKPLVQFLSIDSFGFSKLFSAEDKSLAHLNVYGYGINRIFNSKGSEREDERKEVYLSLFDHSYGLIDSVTLLKDIRFEELDNKDKELPPPTVTVKIAKALLSELLNKEIEIEVSNKAVLFSEKGSSPISFRQLSDGYKSVINWLCDLLSRLTANQPYVTKLEDYYGIVLVDEIGVYLHPSLQYSLVQMLRSKFKKIQWIFTTHSPIITLGASPDAVFYKLYKENGKTKVAGPVNGIAGMTANSLITSLLWRLDDFTTRGTSLDEISSDDYIYKVIHKTVQERIRNNPQIRENDVADMVQKLLNNIKELDSKVKKDLSSDSAIAHKILES